MTKRRALLLAAVFALLAALVYLQFRTWKTFDWGVFLSETSQADPKRILGAIALIYSVYFLRALRWKIFLRPVCRTTARNLTPPQFIGFAGLALLGRPGELIRPYLIARRTEAGFPSQVAVWAVERIFDVGSVTLLFTFSLFYYRHAFSGLPFFRSDPHALTLLDRGGIAMGAAVLAGIAIAFVLRRSGATLADWTESHLRRWTPKTAHLIAQKMRNFRAGLNTIHDVGSFFQLLGISLAIWLIIGLAYVQVTHAYRELSHVELPLVILLMVSSMAGSLLQLPAIGGGSQLATIKVLEAVFGTRPELAVSCGIMLWIVTFMAVIPAGLILAHREHISLREIEAEAQVKD